MWAHVAKSGYVDIDELWVSLQEIKKTKKLREFRTILSQWDEHFNEPLIGRQEGWGPLHLIKKSQGN